MKIFSFICCIQLRIFFSIDSLAQMAIRTDLLKYQNGNVFIDGKKAKQIEFSEVNIPVAIKNELDSKSLYTKQIFQLNDSTKAYIEISKFLDSTFLFEQLDSNRLLQARGLVYPNFDKEIEEIISVIDPITMEETIYDFSHYTFDKNGDWQNHFYDSKYEFGKYENDLRVGSWLILDTTLPDYVVFREDIYNNGTISARNNFDVSNESEKVIKHCITKQNWNLFFSKIASISDDIIIAKATHKTLSTEQYFGYLIFHNAAELEFNNNYKCVEDLNNPNEKKLQKWTLENKILSFGKCHLEIKYMDENMVIFKALNQ